MRSAALLEREAVRGVGATTGPLFGRCACGGRIGRDGECSACSARRRAAAKGHRAAEGVVPRIAASRPLERSARVLTETRLAHDYAAVSVDAIERLSPSAGGVSDRAVGPKLVQRQADSIAPVGDEEEIPLQPGELDDAATGGARLATGDRLRLEADFTADLEGVRIHADSRANALCRQVRARAFTYGDHVFFRTGEYRPENADGRLLLAHELAHVLQQRSGRANAADDARLEHEADRDARACVSPGTCGTPAAVGSAGIRQRRVQRWRYATAADGNPLPSYAVVPAAHRPRVNQAMGIIQRIVNHRANFRRCHEFFQNHCPGGGANTLTNELAAAIVWRRVHPPAAMLASSVAGTHHIAYANAYPIGRWAIAASFIHELIHTCGVASHDVGDDAKAACGRLPNV